MDYTPEGGFYETHAKQGESAYEDAAEFDPPVCPTEDVRVTSTSVPFSSLTKAWPDNFGPSKVYGS